MKREDIEKAAKDYSIGKTSFRRNVLKEVDADNYVLRKGNCSEDFIAGAEWRINSVWHDASERPEKKHANCLVEVKQGDFSFFLVSEFYQNGGFSFMNGICNLILKRWAYIKDLTPNTEE